MTIIRFALTAAFVAATSASYAASIAVTMDTTASGDRYVLNVMPDGGDADLTGGYDTVDIAVVPGASGLINYNATGLDGANTLGPGADQSFVNALLTFPAVIPGGRGFTVLDGSAQRPGDVSDAASIVKSMASLGTTAIANAGGFYLGNAILASGEAGTVTALFLRDGEQVGMATAALGGGVMGDLFNLPSGSDISLQSVWDDFSDFLDNALTLSDPTNSITSIDLVNDNGDVFAAAIDGTSIDLSINRAFARTLPPGTLATATLNVVTAQGDASFTLSASVPEPATFALVGLGLVGLVGLRRRS